MGEKLKELDKNFNREAFEKKWYQEWMKHGVFHAGKTSDQNKSPYVIMMPPPNVTGALHNGHALFVTLQDILARFWRMKGRDVLWLPGTDHAGIATQTVVERELKRSENKSRHDLGREDFLSRVFAWKDKNGSKIIEQLKLLGASADWDRLRFTMDEQCSHAVRTAFVKLWNDGLIYRKERLISYDPVTKTALSNEEVEHVERDGELFFFAYKIKEMPGKEIVVATTRPETMLGDTGVAVNPSDERYSHMIGQSLVHPFFPDRHLSIIADDYVEKDFGTGAVKITPAHDPNDFAMGERHNLERINIFDSNACINKNGGEFQGLDRFMARDAIKTKLESLGLKRKSETIKHAVSVSQRSGVDIEPMLSRQYFVDAKPLAKLAYDAVEDGEVRIIPASFKKTWDHFLINIEDWCISRQLWWGHRIPVYYHIDSMKKAIRYYGKSQQSAALAALDDGADIAFVLRLALDELNEEAIRSFSFALVEEPSDKENYLQEEDVLDTWFSSALWPFSTLGWPHKTDDLARYYPGSVLETGFDILFFWVARMMMFGNYFMGTSPFKDIYLHAMVRDSHGRKMSKSLGNAIDPIDIVEGINLDDLLAKTKSYPVPPQMLPKVLQAIKKDFPEGIPSAGADGLRLSLAMFSGQGRDVKFSIPRVLGYRAFLNKVWNATRFALMNVSHENLKPLEDIKADLSVADRYILSKLNNTVLNIDKFISEYRFSEAADALYQFFWNEYCDRYIECAKVSFKEDDLKQKSVTESVLIHLLDTSMRLLHPFCPFISEEIWQALPALASYRSVQGEFCATAPFPAVDKNLINAAIETELELVFSVSSMIRNARQSSGLSASLAVPVQLFAKDEESKKLLQAQQDLIKHLAKASSIEIFQRGDRPLDDMSVINSDARVDVLVLLHGLINIDKEIDRLEALISKAKKEEEALLVRLNQPAFIAHAPAEIVLQVKSDLAAVLEKSAQLKLAKERFLRARQ
jgi:valyl-tRNA synthetase